ncbi:MAG: sulfatase-like hydrolase/transferase [Gemmatimonadota bacterium]|nr:sulfatase-like hydrolase/transferase [Gemmatimonadota bacterium]
MVVSTRYIFRLCLAALGLYAACAPGPRRPNLLLVSFDTTRADRIGCYGYRPAETPNFDRIAAGGIRFDRAYTPVPTTLPAHASLLTGLYPPAHGVRCNGTFRLGAGTATLAGRFRDEGYATAAFVSAIVLDSGYGLDQGFDLYQDDMITGGMKAGLLGNRELRAGTTTGRALEWLNEQGKNKPFFLFVHYFDPHRPHEAPEQFASRFDDPYDAEIAYTDSCFGSLLAALDSLGLAGNTVVLVCADHGEGLGDHGERTHSTFLYNSTTRVPMCLRAPWLESPAAGTVDPADVSLVDAAATVCSLCGIDPVPGQQGAVLVAGPGQSRPPLTGRPLYLECYYPYYRHGWSPLEAVVRGGRKFIFAPRSELYDLASDPGEMNNLAGADPEAARSMSNVLAVLKQRITPAGGVPKARNRSLSSHEKLQLRSLGYAAARKSGLPDDISILPDPKDMIAGLDHCMLGVTYLSDGRLDLAAAEFYRLLVNDPGNFEALEFLAEIELIRGRFSAALALALRAAAAEPPSAKSFFLAGMASLEQGDPASAAGHLDHCLALDEDYGPALFVTGRLIAATGSHVKALRALEAAAAIIPDNPDVLTELGVCLTRLGHLERAIETLAQAAGLQNATWESAYNLGVALHSAGRLADALDAYNSAAALDSAGTIVFNNLGICLYSLGRYKESLSAYDQALARDRSYAEAWNNSAGSLAALGRLTDAATRYRQALDLDPGYADACINYGMLLAERLGEQDSALALLRRGIALAPDNHRNPSVREFISRLEAQRADY